MTDAAVDTIGWELLEVGLLAQARAVLWCAADDADRSGDSVGLATAALGLGGLWVHEHRATLDQARVDALQRRALHELDDDHPLAHRLRTRLAAERAYATGALGEVFAELDRAGRRGDPIATAEALSLTHHCVLGPEHRTLRLDLAEELIAVSATTGRALDGLFGLMWRTVDLHLAGDRRSGRSLVELRTQLAASPCAAIEYVVKAIDVMLAMRVGRLEDAEAMAHACAEFGRDLGDADADGWFGAQITAIRWMQGRSGELLPMLRELTASPTVAERCPGFDTALAAVAAAAGDATTAATALAALAARGLAAAIPSSSSWLASMHGVCEAAHALGDAEVAAEAYALLAPYADLPVMASLAVSCLGSVHRPLALATLTVGDVDGAVRHLEAAIRADHALGNLPCVAIDRALLATALHERGRPGDVDRAAALMELAVDMARSFGMHARVDAWLGEQIGPIDTRSLECRRDGRCWHVRAGDVEAIVPHSIGMTYLAELVDNPGVAIPALDLATGHQLVSHGVGQPVLDQAAKEHYRQRLDELRADVDDAERDNDLGRASRARESLDRYVAELAAATGIGGRDRRFADDAERARMAVHKALKRAIAAITRVHPALGRAVAAGVTTGSRCSFDPARR